MAVVHVVGAGLAGLATALRLSERHLPVRLYEAAQQAGGRCRSYHDRALGQVIDNGNHLLLSGNRAALDYVAAIGSAGSLLGPAEARFPFLDLASGEHWEVRPNRGRCPLWIAQRSRRVAGSGLGEYLSGTWRLARAGTDATVAACLAREGALWRRFWDPLARAILNTPPEHGSARLLWAALRQSFAQGGAGCRPLIARTSLAASLIDPALRRLAERRVPIAFGQRLRAVARQDGRARSLNFGQHQVALGAADQVVLALPPHQAGTLLPEITVPEGSHAIVNGHFRLGAPVRLPGGAPLLGLVGGTAEWLFLRGQTVSLTVSAADALVGEPAEAIAARLWGDTARALGVAAAPQPTCRIVKERRATFAQTPAAVAQRPPAVTAWANLLLAGDWTATGLPATIEGAIRSGRQAAELAAARLTAAGAPLTEW